MAAVRARGKHARPKSKSAIRNGTAKPAQQRAAAADPKYRTVRKRVSSLKPSPENLGLYRATSDDPDIRALAESIEAKGLHSPLVVTIDNYVVSGHRRLHALKIIDQVFAPCIVFAVPARLDDEGRVHRPDSRPQPPAEQDRCRAGSRGVGGR